ncbi:MAG: GNAT family N-acetyltransferase [Burkholderiaceae bacterium]
MTAVAAASAKIRALQPDDLNAVVALDASIEGRSRRAYVERRLAAARREPGLHAQLAAVDGRGVAGFILARLLEGEFGRSETGLRLEMVGVRDDQRRHGVGRGLLDALIAWGKRHGARELNTTATWRNTGMLRWFDGMGFEMAPLQIIDCAVAGGAYAGERDDPVALPEGHGPGREIDFGSPEANDFERLARDISDVRSMTAADLPEIVRIDRGITGRDRGGYMAKRLAETLADSSIRVSLTSRVDDTIVGYLMARADIGDFGRTDSVAVIDTLGVDPEYAHRGIGHALVSQLFANLGALRVERVETMVSYRDPLGGFFGSMGFTPSQRLAFVRRIA